MQTNEIEAALARLMPPPLSERAQGDLDALIDELSGSVRNETAVPDRSFPWKSLGGIAAGILAMAGGFAISKQAGAPLASSAQSATIRPGMVLISESDRVQSIRDEGWSEQADGSTMHAVRLNLIEENRLMDQETGIVVQVSEPREEIFFTPITAF